MAAVSTSSGPELLHDAEKLTPSDSSLGSQEKRHITGFKVSLVALDPRLENGNADCISGLYFWSAP